MCASAYSKVRITNSYSNPLNVSVGVHQGSVLSSLLFISLYSQPAITCSKLTIETLEEGVKYVQS